MIALARKYRPRRFSELIAQEHIATALRGAVAAGRVAHAYLFAGPRGVGKTTAARILAMALNCPQRAAGDGEPCGVCDSCQRIWTGQANLDVVELDAASNRGVDDARDLRERAMYAASAEGRHKVYIVDEAHMLTREAWNALLKILEEPPAGVVFVFATTEPRKIAQSADPILSRVQRFDFRRIGPHAIHERLRQVVAAESLDADDDALLVIARSADGGMRDGLSLLDQVLSFGSGPLTAQRARDVLGLAGHDVYEELLRLVAERDARAVFPLIDRLLEAGADLTQFLNGVGETLRAVLLVGLGGSPEGLPAAMVDLTRRYAERLPPADVTRLLTVLAATEPQMRLGGNQRLLVELLLLRFAMMDRTVEIGEVLKALGGEGQSDSRTVGQKRGDTILRDSVPSLRPTDRPTDRPTVRPTDSPTVRPTDSPTVRPTDRPTLSKGPLSLDRLRSLWPDIVAHAKTTSPLLGTVLQGTEVTAVDGAIVMIRVLDPSGGHIDGIAHKADALAKVIEGYVTEPVRIKVEPGPRSGDTVAPAGAAPRPPRLTEQSAKAERLRMLRAKDPTLNAAVDALDLELLE